MRLQKRQKNRLHSRQNTGCRTSKKTSCRTGKKQVAELVKKTGCRTGRLGDRTKVDSQGDTWYGAWSACSILHVSHFLLCPSLHLCCGLNVTVHHKSKQKYIYLIYYFVPAFDKFTLTQYNSFLIFYTSTTKHLADIIFFFENVTPFGAKQKTKNFCIFKHET